MLYWIYELDMDLAVKNTAHRNKSGVFKNTTIEYSPCVCVLCVSVNMITQK